MVTNVKVAGTTFHPLPKDQYLRVLRTYDLEGVPCADADAVLVPEPDNPHDKDAVKVLVPLDSGKAFHIGYLPRESSLKPMVKKPCRASVMVRNYALNSPKYSPSWTITEVEGL